MNRAAAVLALTLIAPLLGCAPAPVPEPVVVYASQERPEIGQWLERFTDETGIPVTIRQAASASLAEDVIRRRGSPPADVLVTSTALDIVRAADEGALRPIQGVGFEALPATVRDPDRLWVAIDARAIAVVSAVPGDAGAPEDYAALAAPRFAGRLCLRTSATPAMRALVATLVSQRGVRDAENIVRGWVRNLALPPFETDSQLAAALAAGSCEYAILSGSGAPAGVAPVMLDRMYVDIDGVGIARHARYPESAQRLVDWMLAERAAGVIAGDGPNVAVSGWYDEDARLLAERAAYR